VGGSHYPHADAREEEIPLAWSIPLVCSGEEKNKGLTLAKMSINAHILSAFMHAKMILVLEELGPLGRRRHRG
jgi:hypothetical protein